MKRLIFLFLIPFVGCGPKYPAPSSDVKEVGGYVIITKDTFIYQSSYFQRQIVTKIYPVLDSLPKH